jgi:CRP/FNR family cyclic AMP-dependent transcriptional regulator
VFPELRENTGKGSKQRSQGKGKIMLASEERIRLLSLVDVFEPLSAEEIEHLNGQLPDVHLEAGEIFYSPEDRSERLFVLWKGRVRVYKTADGREFTLAVVEAGTVFGEMALTAQRLQEAYAQAMEPSEVSVIRREDLERLILEKPKVGLRIVHLLSERLRRYETRLEDITLKDITARLASVILLLLESEGVVGPNHLKIPTHYTHQQLGTMIGVNREAVTRAFTELQDKGIVELRRRLIYIADAEALRRVSGHRDEEEHTP